MVFCIEEGLHGSPIRLPLMRVLVAITIQLVPSWDSP